MSLVFKENSALSEDGKSKIHVGRNLEKWVAIGDQEIDSKGLLTVKGVRTGQTLTRKASTILVEV